MPRIEFRWMWPTGGVEIVPTERAPRKVDLQCSPSVSEVRLCPRCALGAKTYCDVLHSSFQRHSVG